MTVNQLEDHRLSGTQIYDVIEEKFYKHCDFFKLQLHLPIKAAHKHL